MWSRQAAADVGPFAGPLAVAAEVAHMEGAPPMTNVDGRCEI